ncbi:hypothetical protein KFL_014410020 [Klebsormidium nitens]|uniref:DNA-directed primase/polymerase protein n=1 Tax=Klebsormidium nitens TaxID=105231 RepID=A0A1Y1IRM9_KLENI|nr:hypothetical protein KFL_014410020 [Klebsormidium nitens]|eukprot:GAQ93324.1 hypothetical protein KFL_014410020 [Klebsormidium nitens]
MVSAHGRRCNLFFDLEYLKGPNPGLSADTLVDTLLSVTEDVCRSTFGTGIWREKIVELDASYARKFSRHLIIHIYGRCFANVHEDMRYFVEKISSEIYRRAESGDEAAKTLIVNQGSGLGQTLIIDQGVYTKTRHLRTIFSTKQQGPGIPFTPTCRLFKEQNITQQITWSFASLVSVSSTPLPSLHRRARVSSRIIVNEGFLSYSFKGTKFCANVNRHHTQNNMYIVVDLQHGSYYQKCHDDVCQAMNYKFPYTKLPEGLLNEARAAVLEATAPKFTKKGRAWGELEDINPDFVDEALKVLEKAEEPLRKKEKEESATESQMKLPALSKLEVQKSASFNPVSWMPKTPEELGFPSRLPSTSTSPAEDQGLSIAIPTDGKREKSDTERDEEEPLGQGGEMEPFGEEPSQWGGDTQPVEQPGAAEETPGEGAAGGKGDAK